MLDISYLASMWEENSERLDWGYREVSSKELEWDIGYLTLIDERSKQWESGLGLRNGLLDR
jgi:hypothetical protein